MEINQLENIFQSTFKYDKWKEVIKNYFNNVDFYLTPENKKEDKAAHSIAKTIEEFGSAQLADNKIIKFYNVELIEDKHVTKNRVGLRSLIHNEVIPGDVDAILVVFHTKGDKDWRLTFISKAMYWDDDFNENKLETSPRRYTYVLGEDESVKTAVKQFEGLENEQITIKHLIELFNVEKLNKKFFENYKKHYNKFWSYLLEKKEYKKLFPSFDKEKQEKAIRDFTKKLLGRIVFLHFLQKKGWMGCDPHPTEWENGEKQFILKLLDGFEDKEHFHSKCLTYLFFNTLNAKRDKDIFKVEGLNNVLNNTKIPYLNGGLFETDKEVNAKSIDFPFSYFEDLFEFFGQYNFTIDENSPDDHEVGIDPEMLGHIFENLLEENKEQGTFYTPKEIVQYMTQESLIQYLQTHLGEHYEIEEFIRNHNKGDEEAKENFVRDNAKKIEELLDNVKICDPAIGSGAFPMGMLHEIFKAKMALDWTLERSEVKKSIIQNSIYGVDLESGAVDIARLRFWLALVVDENTPQALPNLDYKIMQGNSLLESFEGIDLSKIHKGIAIEIDEGKSESNLFSEVLKKKENTKSQEKLEDLIHAYFDLDDPHEKKLLHSKIDKQVLNNIYFTLQDHNEDLQKEYKKLNRKIKKKSATLRTADQKIKYETESKDAKVFKKFNIQLEDIASKQLKLTQLYKSNDRPFFLWHLMFKEVFDEGGFDIVLANPPYVDYREIDTNISKNKKFKLCKPGDRPNLYIYFIEECSRLMKNNGIMTLINPNSFLSTNSGFLLRQKLLSDFQIIFFTDVSYINVFANASTYTTVWQVKKKKSNEEDLVSVSKLKNLKDFSHIDFTFKQSEILKDKLFLIPINENFKFIKRIEENSVDLGDLIMEKEHFFWGTSATGYGKKKISVNDYGLLNDLEKTKYSKIIQTSNIKRYYIEWKNEYIPNEIYSSNVLTKFKQKKIVIARVTKKIQSTIDIENYSVGKSSIIINESSISDNNIIALLNSKLMSYWYFLKFETTHMAGGYIRYDIPYLKLMPIKKSNIFELIVPYIYEKTLNPYTNLFDEIIDALVFELYFPEDFKEVGIGILKFVEQEFIDIEGVPEEQRKEIIVDTYNRLTEKKNPLRNQIKLMKIELKQLLNPILSV